MESSTSSNTEGEQNKGGAGRLSSVWGTDEAMAKYEVEEAKKTPPAAESSGGEAVGMVELKTFRQQETSLDGGSVSPMPLPQSGSAESPSHQRPDAMKDDAERANESPSAAWRAWSEAVLLDTESLDFGGALPVNKMYLEAYLEMLRKLPFDTATLEYVDNQLREFFVDMPPTMDVSVEDSTALISTEKASITRSSKPPERLRLKKNKSASISASSSDDASSKSSSSRSKPNILRPSVRPASSTHHRSKLQVRATFAPDDTEAIANTISSSQGRGKRNGG